MYFHHVEILFQHRTRLEGQHPAGGDGNCLPGLRVPPLSVSLLFDLKVTEGGNLQVFARLQGIFHNIKNVFY